jgi:hypothetical protein
VGLGKSGCGTRAAGALPTLLARCNSASIDSVQRLSRKGWAFLFCLLTRAGESGILCVTVQTRYIRRDNGTQGHESNSDVHDERART